MRRKLNVGPRSTFWKDLKYFWISRNKSQQSLKSNKILNWLSTMAFGQFKNSHPSQIWVPLDPRAGTRSSHPQTHEHPNRTLTLWSRYRPPKRLLPPLAQTLAYYGYINENKSLAYIWKVSNSECSNILHFYSTFTFQYLHICCLRLFSRSDGRELGQGSSPFSNKQR